LHPILLLRVLLCLPQLSEWSRLLRRRLLLLLLLLLLGNQPLLWLRLAYWSLLLL
jgi:hypothetical protein